MKWIEILDTSIIFAVSSYYSLTVDWWCVYLRNCSTGSDRYIPCSTRGVF